MFLNLIPILGAIMAVNVLGERIAVYHAIGAFLVCGGISLIVGIASSNRVGSRR